MIVSLGSPFWLPHGIEELPTAAGSSVLLDASTDRVATVFRVPRDGTIDSVEFRVEAITTSAALRVALQDVDAGTGDPDETDDQYAVIATPTASAWNASGKITAGNSGLDADRRVVTKMQRLAVVIKPDGVAAISVNIGQHPGKGLGLDQYGDRNLTGSYAKNSAVTRAVLKYSDGYVYSPAFLPISLYSKTTIGQNAQRGLRLKLSTAGYLGYVHASLDVDGDATLYVYDANGIEQFSAQGFTPPTITSAYRQGTASNYMTIPVPKIRLERGVYYYVVFQQTSATAVALDQIDMAGSASIMDAMPLGVDWCLATRASNTGAFTITQQSRPNICIGLTDIEVWPQSYWYNKGISELFGGTVDLDTTTLKAMLIKSTYAFDPDLTFVDDGTANDLASHEASGATRQTVAGRSVSIDNTNDTAKLAATNPSFPSVTTGQTLYGMAIFRDTGSDATSVPIVFIPFTDSIGRLTTLTTDGRTVEVDISAGLVTALRGTA